MKNSDYVDLYIRDIQSVLSCIFGQVTELHGLCQQSKKKLATLKFWFCTKYITSNQFGKEQETLAKVSDILLNTFIHVLSLAGMTSTSYHS